MQRTHKENMMIAKEFQDSPEWVPGACLQRKADNLSQ
jgi:hypothetical protein